MDMQEIGVEEARAKLGDLVADAQRHNIGTVITRNGKRAAVIAPIALLAVIRDWLDRNESEGPE